MMVEHSSSTSSMAAWRQQPPMAATISKLQRQPLQAANKAYISWYTTHNGNRRARGAGTCWSFWGKIRTLRNHTNSSAPAL
jgi:hypothetical protein